MQCDCDPLHCEADLNEVDAVTANFPYFFMSEWFLLSHAVLFLYYYIIHIFLFEFL